MAATHPPAPKAEANQDMFAVLQSRVEARLEQAGVAKIVDPTVWLTAFTAVVELIAECLRRRKGADGNAAVDKAIKSPNMVQKVRLRRAMTLHMGRKAYKEHGEALHAHLQAVAAEASDSEVTAFREQVAAG